LQREPELKQRRVSRAIAAVTAGTVHSTSVEVDMTQVRDLNHSGVIAAVLITVSAINGVVWWLVFNYAVAMMRFEGQTDWPLKYIAALIGAGALSILMLIAAVILILPTIRGRHPRSTARFLVAGLAAIPASVIYFFVANYLATL
jgi:uncharacterized membrane-anchored protein